MSLLLHSSSTKTPLHSKTTPSPSPFNPLSHSHSRFRYVSSSSLTCSITTRFESRCFIHSVRRNSNPKGLRVTCGGGERPLRAMISGAPASGKGTQCEMIVDKFGLVHISTGDLLRAEVTSGTEIGTKAKEFMNSGRLVPDEIVTAMVTSRLSKQDVMEKGWLLDGYPRSFNQAQSLEKINIRPDIYIVLDVPDEILIERCIGRKLDPVTGKIYHIKYFPPETEEVKERLITRPDDTEEKVKSRLDTYNRNAEAVSSTYSDILIKVDGNRSKEVVFEDIVSMLLPVQKKMTNPNDLSKSILKDNIRSALMSSSQDKWRGIPTRLNNIPHSKEIRTYFYQDILLATQRAVNDGKSLLKVEINIPELNPEMDVYRIGTLMELVRVLALSFTEDGKRVKVCVQGSMGEGALAGMPLQLAGTRKILEFMDWGDYDVMGTFINIGSIGAKEVDEQDDIFILVAPQNAVGNCIIDDLKAMTDAAGNRPVVLINPRLKDLPASSGIMQTMGRDKRLEYVGSFQNCYSFRLLYYAGTQFPIMGALRMAYPYRHELYKRVDEPSGKEKYVILCTFEEKPDVDEINDAFDGKPRNQENKPFGIWRFLSEIF